MMFALIVCFVLPISVFANVDEKTSEIKLSHDAQSNDEYLFRGFDLISSKFFGIVETLILDDITARSNNTYLEGRKHKKIKLNKYVLPLIIGFLLIKSVLLPLALKALAILSGKAVVLSLMSLILAAIVGLKSVTHGHYPAQSKVDVVGVPLSKYRRKDVLLDSPDQMDDGPYRYYAERRRRRRKRSL